MNNVVGKISMTLKVDPQVIREYVKLLGQKDVLLDEELVNEFKKLQEKIVCLFDDEEHIIHVRLK